MPDLTQGTQIVSNTSGFALPELEVGKFYLIPGGTPAIRTAGAHAAYTGTITVAIGKSAGTLTSAISGLVRRITQTVPNLNGTGTATSRLQDSGGGTVIQLAAQDESTTTSYGTVEPINTNMSWISDTSGTGQATAQSIVLTVHYDL